MSKSKYTLTYFDARARAEVSRLIFAAAGQEVKWYFIESLTIHVKRSRDNINSLIENKEAFMSKVKW